MATYTKIEDFTEQLCSGKHDLTAAGHVVKAMLTLSAPLVTNTIKANLTEIAAGNGYTAGGEDIQNTLAEATGTTTVSATMVVWTCVTAAMAAFRYVTIYNDTQTSPADPLIAFWDYGSSLTLAVGETFSLKFNGSSTTGTLFTLV